MNETLFLPAGDSAVNVEFGRTIDPEINKKIRGLSDSLSRKPIRGVTECIPTFRSLLVCYDPLQTGCEALIKKLKKRIKSLDQVSGGEKRVFNIPVCYGGEFGEDIAFVASHAGLTEQEVIDIHTGRDYLIFMLGFLPGFAYLGDMDKRLHTPRLSNPRTSIPEYAYNLSRYAHHRSGFRTPRLYGVGIPAGRRNGSVCRPSRQYPAR